MSAVDDVVTRALLAVAVAVVVLEGFAVLEGLLLLLRDEDGGATREERGGDVTVATDIWIGSL